MKGYLLGHRTVFPLSISYTEQMFFLVRMELGDHVDTQPVKGFKHYKGPALGWSLFGKFGKLYGNRVKFVRFQ